MMDLTSKYEWVGDFVKGIAVVKKNNSFGAVMKGGKEIIPPIYDQITGINEDEGIFEVIIANWVNGTRIEMRGIYHEEKLVVPIGMDIMYYEFTKHDYKGWCFREVSSDYIVYSFEGYKGLIYKGERASGLICDDILVYSFNYREKRYMPVIPQTTLGFIGLDMDMNIDVGIPSFCILKQGDSSAIYIDEEKHTEMIFDDIKVMNCEGDDKSFYFFVTDKQCHFHSLLDKELNNMDYNGAHVERIFVSHYIADNKLYCWGDDKVIFDANEYDEFGHPINSNGYEYQLYNNDIGCVMFRHRWRDKYAFVFTSDNECIIKTDDDANDGIIEVRGSIMYDIEDCVLIDEACENWDCDSSETVDWERESYYAFGGDNYNQFKENGGELGDMMDKMGF